MGQRLKRWLARPHLWFGLLAGLYLVFFSCLTLASHAAFRTSALDLGIYDQIVWNTAHGRILMYSAEPQHGSTFLATHLQPILLLLAPLYWLWSDVRVLILLQSVAIVASAVPVYILASWKLDSKWAGLAVAFAYLMFPALQAINLFVFHPESLVPLLLLSAFAFFEISRRRLTIRWLSARWAAVLLWIALVLALAVKEDVALVLIAVGAYLFFFRRERRLGAAIMGIAALWFAVGVFGVIPYVRGGKSSPFLNYYEHLGSTPLEIIGTLFRHPGLVVETLLRRENGNMLLSLLLPLGFLPLLDIPICAIAIPALLVNGLSSNPFMQRMEQFQYAAPIIPVVTLAAIYGLGRWKGHHILGRWLPAGLVVLLSFSISYHVMRGFTPLSRLYDWPVVSEHHRIGSSLMKEIPTEASLVAQDSLYPHLSQREAISFVWPSDDSAEYIILDVSHSTLHNSNDLQFWLKDEIERRTDYGLITSQDGFLLLKRGAAPASLSDAFYGFAKVDRPSIQQPLVADFEDGIRFLGYDVLAKRDSEIFLVLYWTATEQPEGDHFVCLYLMNEEGEPLARTEFQQPALVWYPTSQWRMGEIVRVVANTITWSTDSMDRFALGLAVLAEDDVKKSEERLRIQPVPNLPSPYLVEEGTILWLGRFQRQFGATWPID